MRTTTELPTFDISPWAPSVSTDADWIDRCDSGTAPLWARRLNSAVAEAVAWDFLVNSVDEIAPGDACTSLSTLSGRSSRERSGEDDYNATRGMVAVEIDSGDFTVVETLDPVDIEVGDEMQGSLHALGAETLMNMTKGEPVDVVVQTFHVTATALRNQMLISQSSREPGPTGGLPARR